MRKSFTAALAALSLVGGLAAATTADAQSRRHFRDRDNSGAAIAAGVAGLALGAAIGSRGGGYGYGYGYPSYGYGYGGGYYDRPYYGRPYYGRGYGYGYRAPRWCTYWRYDRWGRSYPVRGRC